MIKEHGGKMNNKCGPIQPMDREKLISYVTKLVCDALMPLTSEEKLQVLNKFVPSNQLAVNQLSTSASQIEVIVTKGCERTSRESGCGAN